MNKLFVRLKLIISGLSIRKRLLVFLVMGVVSLPLIAEGLIPDPFALISAQLEGMSEAAQPLKSFMIYTMLFIIVSIAWLRFSVWFLGWASDPEHIEIMGSEAVQIGWQFTSSLANIGIIIALIVIGIATILDRQKYTMKKTLPKLIIVALLINFSLVFVGAVVDVAQITLNTFYSGTVATELTEHLLPAASSALATLTTYLLALVTSLFIPLQSTFAQAAFLTAFFGTQAMIFPMVIETIASSIISLKIASILALYGLFFLIRIFILQILAIFSPLAFVAWAVPGGKKYWKKWRDYLVEWAFLGVILFFFLLLALTITAPLQPETSVTVFGDHSGVPTIIVYYFILGVYLALALYMGKKMAPSGAKAIVGGVKKAATGFASTGFGEVAKEVRKNQRARIAAGQTKDAVKNKKKQYRQAKQSGNWFQQAKAGFKYKAADFGRKTSRATGKSPEEKLKEASGGVTYIDEDSTTEELKDRLKNGPVHHQKRAHDIAMKTNNTEVLKESVNSDTLKRSERAKAADKLAQEGIDPTGLPDFNAEEIADELEKQISDQTITARPDITVNLGIKDSVEEIIEEMDPGKIKNVDWEGMMQDSPQSAGQAARTAVGDSSMLEKLADASPSTRSNFRNSLTQSTDSDDLSEAANNMDSALGRVDKNKRQILEGIRSELWDMLDEDSEFTEVDGTNNSGGDDDSGPDPEDFIK